MHIIRLITIAAAITASIGVVAFPRAEASWLALKSPDALYQALRELKTSLDTLAHTKDKGVTSEEEKSRMEFRGKVQTLQKVIALGKLEVRDLNDRLAEFHIEELVADDFTFDAVETANTLAQLLETFDAYYDDAERRLLSAQNDADIKKIAADIRAWREATYNPGVKKILSLGLVLQNRAALKTASSRFDKILADLRKLKSAELISLSSLEPLITASGASLKKGQALHEDATNIMLRLLRERPGVMADNGDVTLITPHERISNLSDQSFAELRTAYKKFIELNMAVKKMLGIE